MSLKCHAAKNLPLSEEMIELTMTRQYSCITPKELSKVNTQTSIEHQKSDTHPRIHTFNLCRQTRNTSNMRSSTLMFVAVAVHTTAAFSIRTPLKQPPHQATRLMAQGDNTGNPLDAGGELTSALARLDQEWQIQQRAQGPTSRWSKLILPREEEDNEPVIEEPPIFETEQDFVYLLEPPSSNPSCIISFLGGAGLGAFPQIAYNEFLTRVSDRLNAAVITAPYQVGLDHFALSKQSGERIRKAIVHCQDDPARQYSENLPIYSLSHSLGSKLQTIYVAATQQDYDGLGFMAYNNFDFAQTISMAREFADAIQAQQGRSYRPSAGGEGNEFLDTLFGFAEQAIGAIGLDFSPSKTDTSRLIELRYDDENQKKTRLFVFDDDTLDSSRSFVDDCRNGSGPTVSGLPGNHLTPVFFKLGLDDLPEEAREMAAEAASGMTGASFGNEEELNSLVDEVVNWVKGQNPSRGPNWDNYETASGDQPRIAGGEAASS
jgi:hypothetical protein